MSTRILVIAAIVVALGAATVVALAAWPGSAGDAELNAAKTAFTDRGVKFSFTVGPDKWRALQPALANIGSDIPADLRAHTVGYAVSFRLPAFRDVVVFDSPSAATRFAGVARKRLTLAGGAVLVARDVVYLGQDDQLAHDAMASLRKS